MKFLQNLLSGVKTLKTFDVLATVISGAGAARLSIKGVRKIVVIIDDVPSRAEIDRSVKSALDRGIINRL